MRQFLLLTLLSLVAAAPLTTTERNVESATKVLEPFDEPVSVEETESEEIESDEEKSEILKENAFESFRTSDLAKGSTEASISEMDKNIEIEGHFAKSLQDKANEERIVQRMRSPTEKKCSSQTEVGCGLVEEAKDKSTEEASEASEETIEKTKPIKEHQRPRRTPDEKEGSDDTEKETTQFASGATALTPKQNKEEHDGEQVNRVLEKGLDTSTSRTATEQGPAKGGSSGQVETAPGEHMVDGHFVRETLTAEDMIADDMARNAMASGHMAAIHAMETIVNRMREKSSN